LGSSTRPPRLRPGKAHRLELPYGFDPARLPWPTP